MVRKQPIDCLDLGDPIMTDFLLANKRTTTPLLSSICVVRGEKSPDIFWDCVYKVGGLNDVRSNSHDHVSVYKQMQTVSPHRGQRRLNVTRRLSRERRVFLPWKVHARHHWQLRRYDKNPPLYYSTLRVNSQTLDCTPGRTWPMAYAAHLGIKVAGGDRQAWPPFVYRSEGSRVVFFMLPPPHCCWTLKNPCLPLTLPPTACDGGMRRSIKACIFNNAGPLSRQQMQLFACLGVYVCSHKRMECG